MEKKNKEIQKFMKEQCSFMEWNGLMKAVETINTRDWVTIYSDECKIHSCKVNEFEDIQVIMEGADLIDIVFEAVYRYAKYINENGIDIHI